MWLGLLADPLLRALDEHYYAGQETYRTDEWNEQGLFPWERQLVEDHLGGRGRVVVVGCGGGREVLALLAEGFDAQGYEPHPDLVEYARGLVARRGHPDRVHGCPRDRFPTAVRECEAVVVGWGALSLIPGSDTRVRFLSEARERLPEGGPLVLSFFDTAQWSRELRWTARLANGLRRLRGAGPVELGDTLAPNLAHVFTRQSLTAELEAAGLELAFYGSVGAADEATRYACAVARAR